MHMIEYAEDGVEVSHNDVGFQSAALRMLDVEMSQGSGTRGTVTEE